MTREKVRIRAKTFQIVRNFFDRKDFLETDVPIGCQSFIPEHNIPLFETVYEHPFFGKKKLFLTPSPEIYMKRLLANGSGPIYQITKSFRNGENTGQQHNPEFSMLEWYGTGMDYKKNIEMTKELLTELQQVVGNSTLGPAECAVKNGDNNDICKNGASHRLEFEIISIENAFQRWAGFSLTDNYDLASLKAAGSKIMDGIQHDDDWEQTFNKIMVTMIEPSLPPEKGVFLTDYPSAAGTLAEPCEDHRFQQRWELYWKGFELANCFTEMKDPEKLENYFNEERKHFRKSDWHRYADLEMVEISKKLPACSGVAMGMDRVIMALTGSRTIDDVLVFPYSINLNISDSYES